MYGNEGRNFHFLRFTTKPFVNVPKQVRACHENACHRDRWIRDESNTFLFAKSNKFASFICSPSRKIVTPELRFFEPQRVNPPRSDHFSKLKAGVNNHDDVTNL